MEITVMKCPNCSGDINYDPHQRVVKCPYCDSTLNMDTEGRIAEEELRRERMHSADMQAERDKYLKDVKKWHLMKKIYYGVIAAAICTAYLLDKFVRDGLGTPIVAILLIVMIGFPIWLNGKVPSAPASVENGFKLKRGIGNTVKLYIMSLLSSMGGLLIAVIIEEILE
ncbi:MAG: hypothetical protein J5582_05675 [Ruminococcus sp.]|uniref:hypothetical protein n=1 Tax=Ruminococcus sp. TaxID=41978 RepID=UPI0025E0CDEF|nr:hypothetical protein [Ruminococcus sp.]MBO4866044.1 hypothetical protein [Ruminococcus sp.]